MSPATPLHEGYAPRNALNAEALKAGIARRSQARGDSDDIRAWLLNHFYRHLVGNFEPARPITTLNAARAVLNGAPVPAWLSRRLDHAPMKQPTANQPAVNQPASDDTPLVWIDPAGPDLLTLEQRLVEFLGARVGTRLEGKLQRLTCPQALALWEREHATMAARIARGWRQSQPEALRPWLETPHGQFVELRGDSPALRAEMAFESYVMRHCLGQFADRHALTGGYGEHYAAQAEAGTIRLFSFRDAGGQPHITISVLVRTDGVRTDGVRADGRLEIGQIKGKQNRPPIARYGDDVLACLKALAACGPAPDDAIAIGIVHDGADWVRIEDVSDARAQAMLVAHHPQLYTRLARPTAMAEWLVAARDPAILTGHRLNSPALAWTLWHGQAPAIHATDGVPWPGLRVADTVNTADDAS